MVARPEDLRCRGRGPLWGGWAAGVLLAWTWACGGDGGRPCEIEEAQPSLSTIDCQREFELQAARPLDSSLPGARTIKTMIDQAEDDAVHFLDTDRYPFHQRFAVEHLGWPPGQPFVSEYLYPQRRFLLGSVTHYEEPGIWAYELAPYDTASAEMIASSVELLAGAAFFGDRLAFHPVSDGQVARASELGDAIPIVTTDEIYAGISYQPLNLGETVGQVRILSAEELASTYVGPRDLVILDEVPNDISLVAGVVTEAFQTPLSHVNVLSQQRGTPNMALRGAAEVFAGLEGRWVKLRVEAFEHVVEEVSADEAEAWWEAHRPEPVAITPPDASVGGFVDLDLVDLGDIPAVGGKAAHYGVLRDIEGLEVRDGFAIPVRYYLEFLEQHDFDQRIAAMLADEVFRSDVAVREARLEELRVDMRAAAVDPMLVGALEARLASEFPGWRVRFRSSTNAEDLSGFSGAGLYTSASAEPGDPERPVADALRAVWASLWRSRAYEEREYAGIDHMQVAMAILVHPAFTAETANGVAITANLFDPAPGGEDAFYINAQAGEVSVVQPPLASITADQLLYFYFHNGQPATYYTHSSLVPPGEHVLSRRELFELGGALRLIREAFAGTYDPPEGYGRLPMDVEWKRLGRGEGSRIVIKQARPYPGRGR